MFNISYKATSLPIFQVNYKQDSISEVGIKQEMNHAQSEPLNDYNKKKKNKIIDIPTAELTWYDDEEEVNNNDNNNNDNDTPIFSQKEINNDSIKYLDDYDDDDDDGAI